MKHALTIIAIIALFTSCEKESVTPDIAQDQDYPSSEVATNKEIGPGLYIEKGTRRQLGDAIEGMQNAGASQEDIDAFVANHEPCYNRSICLTTGAADIVISGGVFPADADRLYDENGYTFYLAKTPNRFEFSVPNDHISPTMKAEVFRQNKFVMDADYRFPRWVCQHYGVQSIILAAGSYDVTEDANGTISFVF